MVRVQASRATARPRRDGPRPRCSRCPPPRTEKDVILSDYAGGDGASAIRYGASAIPERTRVAQAQFSLRRCCRQLFAEEIF